MGRVAQCSTFMADTRHCSLGTCLSSRTLLNSGRGSDVLSDIFCLMEHERLLTSFPGSCTWAEKELGTHCLCILSSPRISGYLEITLKSVGYTCQLFPCERCLSLTTLCVDDDKGVMKAISSLLTGIIHASVRSS